MADEDRGDRRVRRTKRDLGTALYALIREKNYDKITVQDIIDRADVGRSTFYAHFDTKDDLLLAGLDHLVDDLDAHVPSSAPDGPALPAVSLFRHVAENLDAFRPLFGSRGIVLVERTVLDILTARARVALATRPPSPAAPLEARAAFLAGSLMSFLAWWIDAGARTAPEEMGRMYEGFVAGV